MSNTKRSKRHRIKRNNRSSKQQVADNAQIAPIFREMEAKRKAKWAAIKLNMN